MRAPSPLWFSLRSRVRQGVGVAITVATCVAAEPADPVPPSESKASRLGFRFDQAAHDQAEQRAEPLPPPPPGVIRLPRHVVRERRIDAAPEDLLTPEARVELAKKRHLTPLYRVTFGPLAALAGLLSNPLGGWDPNAPEAMALYEQEQANRRNAEIADLYDLADLAEEAKAVKAKPRTKPAGDKQR